MAKCNLTLRTLFKNLNSSTILFKINQINFYSNDSNKSKKSSNQTNKFPVLDSNLCCREGCDKCYFIEYVNELENYFLNESNHTKSKDRHKLLNEILNEIDKRIDDPSIKTFVKMQVKESFNKKNS